MDGPSLPRSVRWRLQLGLLGLPDEEEPYSLKEIYEYNASLLCDQRNRYKELVEKHEEALKAFMEADDADEKGETKDEAPEAETVNDSNTVLDPLTAMLREQEAREKRRQELELKYRKERARRNRGIYEGEASSSPNGTSKRPHQSHESVEVIDKDLHRLQPDHHTYHHSRKRLSQEGDDFDSSVKERTARLAEILVIHAREHADLNYRQGMHEILSYLLLVIEMDLYDIESTLQSSGTIDEEQSLSLLDASFLVADAYIMFERVMSNLSPAYDVKQSPSQASSPMEELGRSVVSQLKNVVCDQALYNVVKAMHCPPELYCTRWVRLMFSREVLGWRNVLLLWDVFFDLITCHEHITSMEPDKYSKPGVSPRLQLGRFSLMQVLESTAASMILLQRDALIEADHNESIHIFMNVRPLTNVVPLTATLLSLMRRLQVGPEGLTSSTSIASLSASFGQMARGAFQQIESMAPTAGESFRKIYDSALVPNAATKAASADHPLATLEANTGNETAESLETRRGAGRAVRGRHSALAGSLKASTSTITDYLMQVESNGRSSTVPEKVWEALVQIEMVRKQLLDESNRPENGADHSSEEQAFDYSSKRK